MNVALLLEDMGCGTRHCNMVEVGVFAGETSKYLLQRLPLLHLHGIDPYGGFAEQPGANEDVFLHTRSLYRPFRKRARLHRNFSREVAPSISPLDLAFIDGSHLYS